jgi:hypothetical protein
MPVAEFCGTMCHRGQLDALCEVEVKTSAWVSLAGLVSVSGWTLRVETGEPGSGDGAGDVTWEPRRQWSRRGEGDWVEVVQKTS